MGEPLTAEQLEHIERISLTPERSVTIPTMQLRQLVREHRELRDLLDAPMPCGWVEPRGENGAVWFEGLTDDSNPLEVDEALGLFAAGIRAAVDARRPR